MVENSIIINNQLIDYINHQLIDYMQKADGLKELTIEEGEILNYYKEYFFQVEGYETISALLKSIPKQVLEFHKIQVLNPESVLFQKISKFRDIQLEVRKQSFNGLIYLYDLILGYFHLKVSVLNFNRNADEQDTQIQANKIGMGGFGAVRICQVEGKEFAVKRIYFKQKIQYSQNEEIKSLMDFETSRAKYVQIKRSIRQYGIYKICSMLQVGPKVIFQQSFDLHCFNDCIEFYMELCQLPYKAHNFFLEKNVSYRNLQKDLKTSLFKMHILKLIHRDIKPQNVLYSNQRDKFILTDFGLTHTVQNQVWQPTSTTFSGTLQYSSQQMANLYHLKREGMVNLYLNDIYSLKIVFQEFQQMSSSGNHNVNQYDASLMSRNSMSFAESYSNHYSYGTGSNGESQEDEVNSNADSIINTGSSVPILPTNNTNSLIGPGKYSSDINFYQASAIFLISNQYLNNPLKTLDFDSISSIVHDFICLSPKVQSIKEEVLYFLNLTFFPSINSSSSKEYEIKILKDRLYFYLRGYGPDSSEVFQALTKIFRLMSEQNSQNELKDLFIAKNMFQSGQNKKNMIAERKQTQIKTTLHKSRSSICRFKYNLNSVNHKIKKQEFKGVVKQEHAVSIFIQCVTILADSSNVLLQEDMRDIIDLMEVFLSKIQQFHQSNQQECRLTNDYLSRIIDLISNQRIKSKLMSREMRLDTIWYQENSKILEILILILKCLNDLDFLQSGQVFDLIKMIMYIFVKRFSGYEFFIPLSQFCQEYAVQTFQRKFQSIEINQNPSDEIIQELIKNIYFLAKFNHLCTNNHIVTLDKLNLIDKLSSKLKGLALKNFQKFMAFYQDFFVELKMITFIRLNRILQAQKEIMSYFKSLNIDVTSLNQIECSQLCPIKSSKIFLDVFYKNAQKVFSLIKSNYQVTLVQKIWIIKLFNDIKLQSGEKLSEVKQIYELCFRTISQNYSQLNFHKMLFEIVSNLCAVSMRTWDWKSAMKWIEYWYLFLKQNSLNDGQRQIVYICKCFIECLLNFQLIKGEGQDLEGKAEQDIQLIQRHNEMLPEVIGKFMKEKIKGLFKLQLFQHIYCQQRKINQNPLNITYPIKHLWTVNNINHEHYSLIQTDPTIYTPFLGCRSVDQVSSIKKLFLAQCLNYMPYMQWNYRQYSMELAFYYHNKGLFLHSLKYFWIYVEPLLLRPSQSNNQDFQILLLFVNLLIKNNCSHRRALKFLKKFIFYIPPSEFLTRTKAYQLYSKINRELSQIQKSKIETKWIKQLCKNECQLLLNRQFSLLIQFQEMPSTKFLNILYSKWYKKL